MMLAALLLAFSYLSLHTLWQAHAVPILPLGLAPDTFDDAYVGCTEAMEEKAASLLKEEMAHHALLRESWEAAQEAWEQKQRGLTLPPGFRSQHAIAVMVYTNSSNTLYSELNQAVRTGEKRRGCVSVPPGGQPDSPSKGDFSLLSWKTLLLAPGGFQLSGAGP
ncbi:ADP-ribosyltransferase 5 [Rhinolophus ferrumequinum]|uniref:NAD(P)(+)--arginine ADP-ribosyltransferase n=1 Tax=Rhinolophus ferrumequinum TaxID=59479 RepID=A0A7J7W5J9_RHIFE|nr:ADP-ribosyltransferase 5 [Rhinolophus ferrumequinum]